MQSPPARAEASSVISLAPTMARGIAQVNVFVHQFTQPQTLGEAGGQQQPGIGHQAVIVKGEVDAVGVLQW